MYKYNLRKVLSFIYNPRKRSYFPGKTYEAWWCYQNDNLHACFVTHHHIIYYLFDTSNVIDIHNNNKKCELNFVTTLEK